MVVVLVVVWLLLLFIPTKSLYWPCEIQLLTLHSTITESPRPPSPQLSVLTLSLSLSLAAVCGKLNWIHKLFFLCLFRLICGVFTNDQSIQISSSFLYSGLWNKMWEPRKAERLCAYASPVRTGGALLKQLNKKIKDALIRSPPGSPELMFHFYHH